MYQNQSDEETNSQPAIGLGKNQRQQQTFIDSEDQDMENEESSRYPNITEFHQKLTKREKFQAIMLCKKLNIKNFYSSNLQDEFDDFWLIDSDVQESNDWNQVFMKISRANCQALYFLETNMNSFTEIMKSISFIKFKNLKTLILSDLLIYNVQYIIFLELPQLEALIIQFGGLTNIKALHKANFKHLNHINLQNNFISEFNTLSRVRIDKYEFQSLKQDLIPDDIKCNFLCNTNQNEMIGSNFLYKIESNFAFGNAVYNIIQKNASIWTIFIELQKLERDNVQNLIDIQKRKCKHYELIINQNKSFLKRWGLEMFQNLGEMQERLRELR